MLYQLQRLCSVEFEMEVNNIRTENPVVCLKITTFFWSGEKRLKLGSGEALGSQREFEFNAMLQGED